MATNTYNNTRTAAGIIFYMVGGRSVSLSQCHIKGESVNPSIVAKGWLSKHVSTATKSCLKSIYFAVGTVSKEIRLLISSQNFFRVTIFKRPHSVFR
jgi:hypothetical protein